MSFTRWLCNRLGLSLRPASPRKTSVTRRTFRPTLEALEHRWVPSTLTVTNLLDNSPGSLRAEIKAAHSGDTIVFDPNLFKTGPATSTLTTGELLVSTNLTITGPGAGQLTISGNNTSRVFEVASGVQVGMSGLTISNGQGVYYGGGIYNRGTLTISDCTVSGNSADRVDKSQKTSNEGGGIYNGGTLTVIDSLITGNVVRTFGGGIDNEGTMTVSGSTVSNNTAALGGGIDSDGTSTVNNSTIQSNTGGGIYNGFGIAKISDSTVSQNKGGSGLANYGTMTISGGTVSKNNNRNASGGGIQNDDSGTLTICAGAIVSDNTRSSHGGGVFNNYGTVTITGSSLLRNTASQGGGIFSQGGTLTINGGSILSGNTAYQGGGIYMAYGGVAGGPSTLTIDGSTLGPATVNGVAVPGNTATGAGGGIFITTNATATVKNSSTITGNAAPAGYGADVYNLGKLYVDSTSINMLGIDDGNQPIPI